MAAPIARMTGDIAPWCWSSDGLSRSSEVSSVTCASSTRHLRCPQRPVAKVLALLGADQMLTIRRQTPDGPQAKASARNILSRSGVKTASPAGGRNTGKLGKYLTSHTPTMPL
jgi:hypothetical protein